MFQVAELWVEVGPLVGSFRFFPLLHASTMLVKSSYHDVPTKADGRNGTIRIFLIEPNLPDYPQAKFPGCPFLPVLTSWT